MMTATPNDESDDAARAPKYVFLISNAVYAHAIYKLADLLSEECTIWAVVRDSSLMNNNPFEK